MRIIALFFILLFSVLGIHSQTFNEHFGVFEFSWADVAWDVEYINDSIYINYTDQNPGGGSRACVSNLSLEGELIWSKCLDRDSTIRRGGSNRVDAFSDNSKFVVGHTFQTLNFETNEVLDLNELIMYDSQFDTLFTTVVGDSINFFRAKQAKFTPDGGSVMVGWHVNTQAEEGYSNLLVVKFDNEGYEEWQSIHSTNSNSWDFGYSIVALANGNFIVGSTTRESLTEPNRPVITLFDNEGNYLNHQEFGNEEYSEGWANVTALSDGNFIFSATKQDTVDDDRYFVVKFNEDLDVIWEQDYYFYSAEVALTQIKENEDGTLIACGVWEDMISTHDYGTLLKLDANGNLLWHRLYQHANEGFFQLNRLYDVVPIPDNEGYVACGERNAPDNGQNYWVLKVDSMGCLVEGCDTITSVAEIKEIEQIEFITGPNPATDYLNVFLPEIPAHLGIRELTLELRTLEGKLIEEYSMGPSENTLILDVKDYSRGTYLISLISDSRVISSKKVVLE